MICLVEACEGHLASHRRVLERRRLIVFLVTGDTMSALESSFLEVGCCVEYGMISKNSSFSAVLKFIFQSSTLDLLPMCDFATSHTGLLENAGSLS